jgi:hypothetical protein
MAIGDITAGHAGLTCYPFEPVTYVLGDIFVLSAIYRLRGRGDKQHWNEQCTR